MFNPVQVGQRTRYSYARIKEVMEMPHLLDIQRKSYEWFKKEGLQEIFQDISPISDFTGNLELFFGSFTFGEPKYTLDECKKRDGTYAAPVRVKVKLLNKAKGEVKEQEVFLGDFPLMTETGTFIINGAERVIVSQLVRSPGAYYDKTIDQTGRNVFSGQIIPNRGAWIELETDSNYNISVRIDRTRKMPISYLLRALDFETNEQILELFDIKFFIYSKLAEENSVNLILKREDSDPRFPLLIKYLNDFLRTREEKIDDTETPDYFNHLEENFKRLLDEFQSLDSKFDTLSNFKYLLDMLHTIDEKNPLTLAYKSLVDSLDLDKKNNEDNKERALINIYGRLRPGEPPSAENAASLLNSLFFDPRRYDLANVGRFKLNFKLGLKNRSINNCFSKTPLRFISDFGKFSSIPASDSSSRKIAISDIISSISFLFELFAGIAKTDDIDHLGNRRVRAVGELLQNQFRIGMTRMERVVKERMTTQDSDILTPQNLINIRPVVASIKEFFGSSQLSQFMDQHNPLSELTHKRRLSALGPGGLSRERAGFEVRDVHISHYGRMCPIETPEGPNIGLIGSLSNFAIINKFGFIESPYRIVDKFNLKVSNNVIYLDALQEEDKIIAQANEPLINDWFQNQTVTARFHQVTAKFDPKDVDLMDVSPKQVVSCASALIPFLQNDDANRALMGANMQRQAVPLLKTQAPLVGTAMEHIAAAHSGVILASKLNATVANVDSNSISLIANNKTSVFLLRKFSRSNQGTCFNQRPIVHIGQKLKIGQPFADGPATNNAELALGFNVIVAYMPWEGFNYEDAILLNQNLLKFDIFSSIHIEEFQCDARDTKLGPEEVTRDIPNLSDDALANLDSDGIISIGSDVQTGDILVGKVTPKGETELSAEERLLRAIFGEKAREVRDSSLRVPHGEAGKVVSINIFTRQNNDELQPGVNKQVRVYIAQKRKISVGDKMSGRHGNKGVVSEIRRQEDMPFLPDGTPVDIVLNPLGVPSRMNIGQILEAHLGMAARLMGKIIDSLNPKINRAKEINLSIGSLNDDITNIKAEIDAQPPLPERIASINAQILPINSQIKSLNSKITQLNSELNQLENDIIDCEERIKQLNLIHDEAISDYNQGIISKQELHFIIEKECAPEQAQLLEKKDKLNSIKNNEGAMWLSERQKLSLALKKMLAEREKLENETLRLQNLHKNLELKQEKLEQLEIKQDEIINNLKQDDLLQRVITDLGKLGYDATKINLDDIENFELPETTEAGVLTATPVFDGARDHELITTMHLAGMDTDGKSILYDGRTGLPFENRVTVGCVYMLKLHHLVDDKIHARSTGPYSLVTQQPLGGKAQFGGQRFGEMEVWALEAYGAAFSLQEILTVKSDDVVGRVKAYEAIVKGQNIPEPGVPESFKVLIKELQSIALDIRVLSDDSKEIILHELDDEDDASIRKKAELLDVDVGSFGDHLHVASSDQLSDNLNNLE